MASGHGVKILSASVSTCERFCQEHFHYLFSPGTVYYRGSIAGISLGIIIPILLIVGCTLCCVVLARRQGEEYHTGESGE